MSDATPPTGYPNQTPPLSPADEKLWAILIHAGGIVFLFLPALIGYLVLRDRGPFVRAHTAAALNFQITMVIAYFLGLVTSLIGIGVLVLFAVHALILVFSILAAIAANQGQQYRYPLAFTFVN